MRLATLLLTYLFILFCAGTNAQQRELIKTSSDFTPHYAFSNYFGAGLYSSTGQNIHVVNLPLFYEPKNHSEFKYRIRLPVSIGFYDFDINDIDEFAPLEDAATMTVTLGIEFDHWINKHTKLVPFLDIGLSENFSANDRAILYASGITAYNYFTAWQQPHTWLLRFQRAGYQTKNNISDGFSAIELGLDLRWPWQGRLANNDIYLSNYFASYWYTIDIAFDPTDFNPKAETNALEAGLTVGLQQPWDLGLFKLERMGVGYRYSNNAPDIIRISFNFPLD